MLFSWIIFYFNVFAVFFGLFLILNVLAVPYFIMAHTLCQSGHHLRGISPSSLFLIPPPSIESMRLAFTNLKYLYIISPLPLKFDFCVCFYGVKLIFYSIFSNFHPNYQAIIENIAPLSPHFPQIAPFAMPVFAVLLTFCCALATISLCLLSLFGGCSV